jgi:hypothetical protein
MSQSADFVTYFDDLQEAGVPINQARIHANTLAEVIDKSLVTKNDLQYELKQLEYRLTIKLASIIMAGFSMLGITLGILIKFNH